MNIDWAQTLTTLAVASVPALAAIIAAVIAARSARRAKTTEVEAARLRQLEQLASEEKYRTYKSFLDLFIQVFADSRSNKKQSGQFNAAQQKQFDQFATWVSVYGSDEAVIAAGHFMQAAFSDAPPTIFMRIFGDLLVAIRRDVAVPSSAVSALDVWQLRINDLFEDSQTFESLTMPFDELCERADWTPPWTRTPNQNRSL